MPEGDTVWLAASRLHTALAGSVLVDADLRVPQAATVDLTGREILAVVPRGKHLLTRLAGDGDDPEPGGLTLHTHFRMDGAWHLFRRGERWTAGPAWQIRAVLGTRDWSAVGYRLHDLQVLPTAREPDVVGHLGPDLLGPDWDLDEAVRRLRARPDRAVSPALLDQRNLAGIGLLYATEVCFLRGVSPWTRILDVPDLPGLVRTAQRMLAANRGRWEQSTTGDTRRGREHWVFKRGGRPCRRCGTPVRVAEQSEARAPEQARVTAWCPHCQPGPSPEGSTG